VKIFDRNGSLHSHFPGPMSMYRKMDPKLDAYGEKVRSVGLNPSLGNDITCSNHSSLAPFSKRNIQSRAWIPSLRPGIIC